MASDSDPLKSNRSGWLWTLINYLQKYKYILLLLFFFFFFSFLLFFYFLSGINFKSCKLGIFFLFFP